MLFLKTMWVKLDLSEEQLIRIIDFDIDIAKQMINSILLNPSIFKYAINNPDFYNYFSKKKSKMVRKLISNLFVSNNEYFRSDGSIDKDSIEFLLSETGIYDDIVFRTLFVYHLMKYQIYNTIPINNEDFQILLIDFLEKRVDIYAKPNINNDESIINLVCLKYDVKMFKLFLSYHPDIFDNINNTTFECLRSNINSDVIDFILEECASINERNLNIIERSASKSKKTFYLMMSHPDYINYLRLQNNIIGRILVIFNAISNLDEYDFDFFMAESGYEISQLNTDLDNLYLILRDCDDKIINHIYENHNVHFNDIIDDKCIIDHLNDRYYVDNKTKSSNYDSDDDESFNGLISRDDRNEYIYVLGYVIANEKFILTKKNISAIRIIDCSSMKQI